MSDRQPVYLLMQVAACRWQLMFTTKRATLSIGLPLEWPNYQTGRIGFGPFALSWWPARGEP